MKHSIHRSLMTLSLVVFVCCNLFGQSGWPMLDSWWAYRITSLSSAQFLTLCAVDDTIVDQKRCTRIDYKIISSFEPPGEQATYQVTDSGHYAYISNSNDSIFFNYEGDWRFMYSFNASVGDSYRLFGVDSVLCDSSILLAVSRSNGMDSLTYNLPLYNEVVVSSIEEESFGELNVQRMRLEPEEQTWGFQNGIFLHIGPAANFLPQPIGGDCFTADIIVTESLNCFSLPNGVSSVAGELCSTLKDVSACERITSADHAMSSIDGSSILLYPNPGRDVFTIRGIDLRKLRQVQVYDLNGRLVMVERHSQQIDLSDRPAGVYLVKIIMSDKVFTTKISKL